MSSNIQNKNVQRCLQQTILKKDEIYVTLHIFGKQHFDCVKLTIKMKADTDNTDFL